VISFLTEKRWNMLPRESLATVESVIRGRHTSVIRRTKITLLTSAVVLAIAGVGTWYRLRAKLKPPPFCLSEGKLRVVDSGVLSSDRQDSGPVRRL
jgi:hypothetical protein